MSDGGHVWWEDAIVYEVYPRSFADAVRRRRRRPAGPRSRLGYLADLGVDAIGLTPFYPSPLADGGYDVSSYYCAVDPLLGTMADFYALVSSAAAHQIRVIIDLVPNHCSSAHPPFRAALGAAPGSDERARFIFRDGRGPGGGICRTTAVAVRRLGVDPGDRGRRASSRVGTVVPAICTTPASPTGKPDHPGRTRAVRGRDQELRLDRGVAGLRVDVAHGIVKDPGLPDLTVRSR